MNLVLAELLARLSLGCPPAAPLPRGAGLGLLDRHPLRICESREWYLQNLQKDSA